MESMSCIRQEEGFRFIKWTADYPNQWSNILNMLSKRTDPQYILKALEVIKEFDFYFLLPIVLDRGEMDCFTDAALNKLLIEKLIETVKLYSFDSVCQDIIKAITSEAKED